MKRPRIPCLVLCQFALMVAAARAATPAEQADHFHQRGLAAEKREDFLVAERCYELALRTQPSHSGAMAEKTRLAKWAQQPEKRMQSATLRAVIIRNATLVEALQYLHQHTGVVVEDGDADDAALQNLAREIEAWHKVPVDKQKAAWAELLKRTRHGRALQKLADAVIASRQAHFSLDRQEVRAEDLLKEIAERAGVTIHHREGKILYSVRKALPTPPVVPAPPKASAATLARLTQLEAEFKAAGADAAKSAHDKSMTDLRTKYSAAVKRAQEDAKKAGDAATSDALQEEQARAQVGTDVPEKDDPGTPAALVKLRGIYRQQAATMTQTHAAQMKPLLDRYDAELAALETTLAAKPEDLATVKAVRARIAAGR